MKNKKIFLLFLSVIVLLFVSCSTTNYLNQDYRKPKEDLNLILNEISECDNGVYSGISGVYSTKKKMMDKSLLDAAKNVLIHNKTALKNQIYGESSDNSNLFLYDQHIQYSETQLLSVIENLEVLSIKFSDSLGCVVLTKYMDSNDDFPSFDLEKNATGIPKWTLGKLEIQGYVIGIGKTEHYSTVRASIEAADYLSVDSVFSQVSDTDGFVIHNQMLSKDNYSDQSFQGNINTVSGVKIIARYYDEIEDIYYSLAMLKKE